MSEIRVNNVIADNGLDAVNFSKGINVSSGIITATTFSGNVNGNVNTDRIIPTGGVPSGGGGGIIQILQGSTNSRTETSSQSFVATNLSATITPKFSTSKIFVMISGDCNTNADDNEIYMTIFRSIDGGTFSNIGDSTYGFASAMSYSERLHSAVSINYLDSPSTTSSVEYKFYIRKTASGSGNVEFPVNNGAQHSFITLMEVSG